MACASCGAENPAGNRFCGACGAGPDVRCLRQPQRADQSLLWRVRRLPPGRPGRHHPGAAATVQVVLSARIDRLPPGGQATPQTAAAVIGKDLPFVLLQRIAETPTPSSGRLSRLQAAELLYAVSLFPELELTFKHALTYEVAYGGLLQERRRALHARIVEAIETLYPDRLVEHVERLAHHAFRGQLWKRRSPIFERLASEPWDAPLPKRRSATSSVRWPRSIICEDRRHVEQAIDVVWDGCRRIPHYICASEWASRRAWRRASARSPSLRSSTT